tara:strand:+ start:74 stop:1369 length:1296 start_codon:yes stop_codon:yes gene_type:complete
MNLCVIGLGKLGYPMAEFLSSSGLSINCYDKNEKHLLNLKNGNQYLKFEKSLESYRKNNNDLNYSLNINDALKDTEICFITVPTPSLKDGNFDNSYILEVLNHVSKYLKINSRDKPYIININSTVMPGSFKNELIPYMEKAGLKKDIDFSFVYNPYFVALGDVIQGLEKPDFVLVGYDNIKAKNKLTEIYNKIYKKNLTTNLNLEEAEYVKLLVNSYLTLKISFSNMVKIICNSDKNLDASIVLKVIGLDSRIGQKYLKAGGPFSGPCLPRDVEALKFDSKRKNLSYYIAEASSDTNKQILTFLKNDLVKFKNLNIKTIIFAGIGYKSNTSSLEETYILELGNYLTSNNFKVYFYDDYITHRIPDFERIDIKDLDKYSSLIFLPYVDQKFNSLKFKGIIYDIWGQTEGTNVVRSFSDIKKPDISNIISLRK